MVGDSGGDYREEEAVLLKALSETKYKSRDIASALKYAIRAHRVFPSLLGIQPLVSSLRILGHVALLPLPLTQPDYYGILQLEPFSDVESVRRQYKNLALMLHPDKNPSFVCQDAFKAVGEALRVLSDSKEKERYDLGLRVRMQEEGIGKGGDVGFGSEGRFWSRCGECGELHDLEKRYAGKRLVCSSCGKTFKAVGVADGTDSESEETDEDPGIVTGTSGLKETSGGDDTVVKSGDIIYVRKRKRIANKFRENGAIGKRMSDDGNSVGRVVGVKKVRREGIRESDGYGYNKGRKRGSEMDEGEGFWDLKLKDGLKKKGKKVETSGGWWSKLKASVEDDETKNDGEEVRNHVVSGLKVRSTNARMEAKSGKMLTVRDVEGKEPLIVMGLRCVTEEERQKLSELSDMGSSDVHQTSLSVVVGGTREWGGSRRRSTRMVKPVKESALILFKQSDASGEELMTLAEMQSRLLQKRSGNRRRTSNQKKKIKKEKKSEEAEVKLTDGGNENEDERVVEQIVEDDEEELRNNELDADEENESKEKEEEEEEKASGMDEEREIAKPSVKEDDAGDKDDDDERQDRENVNKEGKKEMEMEMVLVAHERSEDGEDQTDMTDNMLLHLDGTTERGTWRNGDEVEETTTDTRWAKRIRCYETKRRALSKRSKDSGVEILETSGPPGHQSDLAIIEQPIVTKSRSVRHTVSSNSDFYNFDKDRGERNFKKGQVWAVYDEYGLPRQYALIEEVVSINPFAVHLKWLAKQDMKGQHPTAPCSACGRFKVTTSSTVQSVDVFSHEVDGDKVGRETYDIYPKKDSVWAIYVGDARHEGYDIVVCLTSYIDMFGLSLAYVEKVEGFRTVYKRKEFGWHAVRWLGKDEIFLLSHQVPARRLSHEEGSDFEEDCWVLDPASIPPTLMV